jgi:tetratricopeptide (TPR) repeat protein
MASIFLKLDDLDFASNCLLKAIDLNPSNPDAYYYLGCINILKGRTDSAAELLRKAIELNPQHTAAVAELANLLLTGADFPAALEQINRLRQICPRDSHLKKLEKSYAAKQVIQRLADFFSRFRLTSK